MKSNPIHAKSPRKTWSETTRTGESTELTVRGLTQEDIGVEAQNHSWFSTLTITLGNVNVTCFVGHEDIVNDDDICVENLKVIDTLINKLMDVEHDIRLEMRNREFNQLQLAVEGGSK